MIQRRILCALGWVLVALLLVDSVRAVIYMVPRHSIVDEYIGPLYFVDYSDGFIRRGLPGEVMRLLTGGHGRTSTEVAGWALTLLAALAVVAIALQAARRRRDPYSRCLVATLALLTPLSVTTILRDPGRYDAVGIVFLGLLLWVTRHQLSAVALACVVSVVFAAVVASEEFLIAYLAPSIVLVLYSQIEGEERVSGAARFSRRLATLLGIALVPACALAIASLASRPSPSYLDRVQQVAQPRSQLDPTYFLGLSLRENIHYVSSHGARYVVATGTLWFLIFALTLVAIWLAGGRYGSWYWLSGAYFALVAVTLSVVALDARRWWTLAFLGHLAVVAARPVRESDPVGVRPRWTPVRSIIVGLAFAVSVYSLSLSKTVLHPTDVFFGEGYRAAFTDFWLRAHSLN